MALHDIDQVDLISLDNNNKDIVYLTIFDALNWKEEHEHALLLQDKINNYLAFIESGEVYETTPETVGKNKFVIQVYALHELTAYGKSFMLSYEISYMLLDMAYSLITGRLKKLKIQKNNRNERRTPCHED